jgi:hypothetical protein
MFIKVKVIKISQEQSNPFKNRIRKWEWVRWLRKCHSYFILKVVCGLEIRCMKGLCLINVQTFYTNLETMDNIHDYQYITCESLSKFYIFKSKQFKGISLQNVNLGLQWVCNLELG